MYVAKVAIDGFMAVEQKLWFSVTWRSIALNRYVKSKRHNEEEAKVIMKAKWNVGWTLLPNHWVVELHVRSLRLHVIDTESCEKWNYRERASASAIHNGLHAWNVIFCNVAHDPFGYHYEHEKNKVSAITEST